MADNLVRIEIVDQRTGSVVFDASESFRLLDFTGFGTPENDIKTSAVYGMDGVRKVSSSLSYRDMNIKALIRGRSFEETTRLTNVTIKKLSPKSPKTLRYYVDNSTYEIDVEVVKGIDAKDGRSALFQKVNLDLRALDPLWRDTSAYDQMIPLNKVTNTHVFPLMITSDYKFAVMEPGVIIDIENKGDVAVGAVFCWKITGTVTNPRVVKISTDGTANTFFGFNGTYELGDEITFSTVARQKYASYTPNDEEKQNWAQKRTIGSKWLTIDADEVTYLKMEADDGVENIVASMTYTPLLTGVK